MPHFQEMKLHLNHRNSNSDHSNTYRNYITVFQCFSINTLERTEILLLSMQKHKQTVSFCFSLKWNTRSFWHGIRPKSASGAAAVKKKKKVNYEKGHFMHGQQYGSGNEHGLARATACLFQDSLNQCCSFNILHCNIKTYRTFFPFQFLLN